MVVSDCLLNNSLLHERHVVLETLFAIGADPACAHAILTVARQEGKGTQTRHLALAVLGAIRPVPAEALPFLQELGQDTQDPVAKEKANQILKAAAEHGTSTTAPKASPVHYRHVFAANDTDQILAALDELGERRATATQLIPSLVRLSTHAHGPVREKALEVLSDLGASAQTASPALMENGLREQDPHKRLAVFHAIQMIDPQGTSAGPSAALALDDPFKAANAIQLLEMYGNTSYAPAVEVAKKRWRLR